MLFVALGLAILCIPKGELHLLLCNHHTPARDLFFRYYTQIAEYLPYIVCGLLLLFGRAGDAAMSTACVAGADLTTQIIKHIANAPRPVTWFATHMPDVQLPLVEGVRMNRWFSFPSGHTTSFFALFFVASILISRYLATHRSDSVSGQTSKRSDSASGLTGVAGLLQASFFMLAALGGYSRIYLSQHFAADVMAGIGIGLTISCIAYAVFARWRDKKWYNYRLIKKK